MLLLPSRLAPCHLPQRGRLWFYAQTKLVSPFGRDVAQRQRGLGSLFEGAVLPPCGKTEGVLQIDKIRMRFALVQTCSRAALSVICHANASSPKGRAKKPVRTVRLTNQVDSYTDLLACCSFRHGLRRATFLKEEGFFHITSLSVRQ